MQRRRKKRLMADINVVPYIDVMLVLLIIFMVTAPLVTQGVKVELPQASSEPVPPNELTPVTVSVNKDGEYFVDIGDDRETPVSNDELITKVQAIMKYKPKTPVLVNGDADVPYEKVVRLMSLLQTAGAPSIGLLTKPVEGSSK